MEPIVKILHGLVEDEDTEWVVDPDKPGIVHLQKKEELTEEPSEGST
jgi:hypothetical protein